MYISQSIINLKFDALFCFLDNLCKNRIMMRKYNFNKTISFTLFKSLILM